MSTGMACTETLFASEHTGFVRSERVPLLHCQELVDPFFFLCVLLLFDGVRPQSRFYAKNKATSMWRR